jgi:hypothetical protein
LELVNGFGTVLKSQSVEVDLFRHPLHLVVVPAVMAIEETVSAPTDSAALNMAGVERHQLIVVE